MPELRLEAKEFDEQATRWRWVLTDHQGKLIADYQVDVSDEQEKLLNALNLAEYVQNYLVPDRREDRERSLLHALGEWIGTALLGEPIGNAIVETAAQPICVRVMLAENAERLLYLPLDIAHVNGEPLARQGVRFVFQMKSDRPPPALPVGNRLRILALFSLPPRESPLNLRRERQMLNDLVHGLIASQGLAVELRILQYGVTRANLRDALEDGEGWDVVHFSGHGMAGSLVLEATDGRADLVSSAEVGQLLRLTGQQLKLVVLSSCLSAAATIRETLSDIGVELPAPAADAGPASDRAIATDVGTAVAAVAQVLSSTLDCAVLAMRYAVEDEFATALSQAVYEGLFLKRQTLPHALQLALIGILRPEGPASDAGPLSLATPALFGARAVDLKLVPPVGDLPLQPSGMAHFRDPPAYFVGRVGAMTTASSSLAPESPSSGVLFHGMAGAGKTTCAVELAYHHAAVRRFRAFIWYAAPAEGADISFSLREFAVKLERQLPNFAMMHVIDSPETLRAWLPLLTETLRNFAALVVLDNIDTLLDADGHWRDERWGLIVEALTKPGGLSRVVLTSRIRPAQLAGVEAIPVHALPLNEAVLLVRQLPNLRHLLEGPEEDRILVQRTLRLVQGHPKLIHLAEGLAGEPARLSKQLERAEAAAGSGELEAFFQSGETVYDVEEFTSALRNWTIGIADTLPETAKFCFQFLCAIEEGDRDEFILEMNWAHVWRACDRPDPAPALAEALASLVLVGLIEMTRSGDAGQGPYRITIHPGVAEAGRSALSPDFRRIMDRQLASTWGRLAEEGQAAYGMIPYAGPLIVRAGLAAYPYLRRLQSWQAAGSLLEQVVMFDSSPSILAAVIPRARQIAEAAQDSPYGPWIRATLGKILADAGHYTEAEKLLKSSLGRAVRTRRYDLASVICGNLINMLRKAGRLDEALKLSRKRKRYTQQSGLGEWSQLANETTNLQVMTELGHHEAVLKRALELKNEIEDLKTDSNKKESITPWSVKEGIYDLGREAALLQGEFKLALDFSALAFESMEQRNATALEIAEAQLKVYAPLMILGRIEEARQVACWCRDIFEAADHIGGVGKALGALASIEFYVGQFKEAYTLHEAALRFLYADGEPQTIAVGHAHLALCLVQTRGNWHEIIAHDLAAAFLDRLSQRGPAPARVYALASHLHLATLPIASLRPPDFAALCELVQRVDGIRFGDLVERLSRGKADPNALLHSLLTEAEQILDRRPEDPPGGGGKKNRPLA